MSLSIPPPFFSPSKDKLTITGVTKAFGGVVALDGTDMNVGEGTVSMLIGPNGSGKTTLINVVCGLYKPDSGSVHYESQNVTGWPPFEIYKAGLVRTFQIPLPFTKLTVLENLLTAEGKNPGEEFIKAPLKGLWASAEAQAMARAFEILEMLRLDEQWDQEAQKLSGGQMKLLEIGRALMSGARMIMMDEPISGINPVLAHEIFSKIRELRDRLGVTFLLIEHRLEIALQYVDHVFAMDRGKIVAEGRPDDVIAHPKVIESYLGD